MARDVLFIMAVKDSVKNVEALHTFENAGTLIRESAKLSIEDKDPRVIKGIFSVSFTGKVTHYNLEFAEGKLSLVPLKRISEAPPTFAGGGLGYDAKGYY